MTTIVLTGATGAVGGAAASALVRSGHSVVLLGRTPERLSEAAQALRALRTEAAVETAVCDLSSLASIRAAAADLTARFSRIDGLVHCAAVFVRERKLTSEGFETMLATNHLGPFLLTDLLLERLRTSAPSRVVTVSAPSTTALDFEDLGQERRWSALTQFGRTKMANLLFAYRLARTTSAAVVTSNVFFPGLVRSGLMREANAAVRGLSGMMSRAPAEAGDALAWLVSDPATARVTGQFYKLRNPDRSNAYSRDPGAQDRLWSVSRRLVGLDPAR